VSYHVSERGASHDVVSSSDLQPDGGLSYYVNAADIDTSMTHFDSRGTVASKASSGYQSVEGSAWDVMSFDNPLFRAFSFRSSGRRQLVSPPSPGPSTQSTV